MTEISATVCREYRFGLVRVEVYPELVLIAVPYGAGHDDFCDASMFVERYTHGADATSFDNDELAAEFHLYPNTENLVGRPPHRLPPVDPRLGLWDEVSRRPSDAGSISLPGGHVPADEGRVPMLIRLIEVSANLEQYTQEFLTRAAAGALVSVLPLVAH